MLNVFKPNTIKQNRIGYLVQDNGEKVRFNFSLAEREDYTEIQLLTNIDASQGIRVIKTTSSLVFRPGAKIMIKGIAYIIDSYYGEEMNEDITNGVFTEASMPIKYISIRTDATPMKRW